MADVQIVFGERLLRLPEAERLHVDANHVDLAARLVQQRLDEPLRVGRKRRKVVPTTPLKRDSSVSKSSRRKSYADGSGRVSRYSVTISATCSKKRGLWQCVEYVPSPRSSRRMPLLTRIDVKQLVDDRIELRHPGLPPPG